jgi:hypothetical protein
MMDFQALKTYILADAALSTWVADGTDFKIADTINARTVPVVGSVSRPRFAMWAGATGLRAVIQDHADNPASPLRSVSLTLLDFLRGAADTLDLSDSLNQQMLSAWVHAGALTQAQADELIEMATTQQPIFGQTIHHLDVAHALRGTP